MSKIKGNNFRLFVSGSAVPEETNCSVTIIGNTEDSSTKSASGLFSQETVVNTSWQAQVDSFQAEVGQLQSIIEMFNAAQPVPVGWDETKGDNNSTGNNASFKRSGNALLNDFTFQFDDRQTVTTSLQFQGTGALS